MEGGTERRWSVRDTLVVVSIVATGVIVAGLLHTPTAKEYAAPAHVTPRVEYPTTIPGCDTVAPPSSGGSYGLWSFGSADYDNPRYPWFTAPKATAMSEALRAGLPGEVQLEFADPDNSLTFQPIPDYSGNTDLPDGITEADIGGDTTASGMLTRGSARGRLNVVVRQWNKPVPECVAGQLDSRTGYPDGAVVDTLDTWAEYDGVRSLSRRATAYLPDGTQVDAWATDEDPSARENRNSGAIPLTVDELAELVRVPALATTAAVAPGTPAPVRSCGGLSSERPASRVTPETVAALDRVLDDAWRTAAPPGLVLDRPLGSLQPAERDATSVCTEVTVMGTAGTARLSLAIGGGYELPVEPDRYDPLRADDNTEYLTMADGSVVQRQPSGRVTVTHPSGFQVRLSVLGDPASRATGVGGRAILGDLLTLDRLQTIAATPGLQW